MIGSAGKCDDREFSRARYMCSATGHISALPTGSGGVIEELATRVAEERKRLEQQSNSGGEASTEDMRQTLQHYKNLFQRLLALGMSQM